MSKYGKWKLFHTIALIRGIFYLHNFLRVFFQLSHSINVNVKRIINGHSTFPSFFYSLGRKNIIILINILQVLLKLLYEHLCFILLVFIGFECFVLYANKIIFWYLICSIWFCINKLIILFRVLRILIRKCIAGWEMPEVNKVLLSLLVG